MKPTKCHIVTEVGHSIEMMISSIEQWIFNCRDNEFRQKYVDKLRDLASNIEYNLQPKKKKKDK